MLIKDKINTLCVFGSRSLNSDEIKNQIKNKLKNIEFDWLITSGETHGICELVRDLAKEEKYNIKLCYANNRKFAAGKYEHRAIDIIKQSDYILFFWDGKSKGTKNEILLADKLKKQTEIVKLKQTDDFINLDFDFLFNAD